jgi:DNA adenine methylase
MLLQGSVSTVHINDIDPSIHAFWHSVLREPDELCRLIRDRPVSVAEWRRQRAIQHDPPNHSLLELGFSTFFLNRTNRSGIICSGGMIGGTYQSGAWKLDARFKKTALIERIERVAAHAARICLHRDDAGQLLTRLLPTLPKRSFVYLDPPYYLKGTRRLYANFYEHADHAYIANAISQARSAWLVSYDDRPEIRRLYRGFRSTRYRLSYTARDRYEGDEVLFFSNGLTVPPLVTRRR